MSKYIYKKRESIISEFHMKLTRQTNFVTEDNSLNIRMHHFDIKSAIISSYTFMYFNHYLNIFIIFLKDRR